MKENLSEINIEHQNRAEAWELRELASMFAKIKNPSTRSGILKEINLASQRT